MVMVTVVSTVCYICLAVGQVDSGHVQFRAHIHSCSAHVIYADTTGMITPSLDLLELGF